MCYTCGCRLPYEDHGDPRNLVESAFVRGGRTKEIKRAGRVRAKLNTLELLLAERRRGDLADPRKSYAKKKGA
jgi:hypothetical protein